MNAKNPPIFLAGLLLGAITLPVFAQSLLDESDERVIHYDSSRDLSDPIACLQRQLAAGTVYLTFETNRGYLPSLLSALGVPVSSQTLVFSKTSSQRTHTSPQTPRAIYFSDAVSVGWAKGAGDIDIASIDPRRGAIFYTLSQNPVAAPKFARRAECMQCHLGPKTINVPGMIVRSFYTASNGTPVAAVSEFVSGHNAPLASRWGGWYVTGYSEDSHLGNSFVSDLTAASQVGLASAKSSVLNDLRNQFDTSCYLSPHSDIVALLVLEHQVRMQNLITHAQYETLFALDQQTNNSPTAPSWIEPRIARAGEMLLEYLLFRNEAPLKGPVRGSSGFAAEFQVAALRDSKGRSLRDLDLNMRLFRYPCSYLIYSPSFDALPSPMKTYLWHRLDEILTGRDQGSTYATMTSDDRRNILEILRATKPEFAAFLEKQHEVTQR
jgi:hypothetical protein